MVTAPGGRLRLGGPAALLLLLTLLLATGCPTRMVVIDGEQVPYAVAASRTFERARAAHDEGRHEEAVERLRDYLAQFRGADDAAEARWLLARSYAALERDADHRRALGDLLEHHPLSEWAPEARLELGLLLLKQGAYNDALQTLRPAYDATRGEEKLAVARALFDAAQGLEDWTGAVQWIGEIRRLARDPDAQAEADRALFDLIDRKVPAQGLAELRQRLSGDSPALPLVVMKIARLHYHQREYGHARTALDQYLSRWPQGAHADDARALIARIERLSEVQSEVVGLILPLSGRFQHFGEAVLRGVSMALDTAGGRGVTLLVRDSEGDPGRAAALVEELVLEEKAVAIIGPLLSNTSMAAGVKAEELGVPMIGLSRAEGLTELGPWIFRNALSDAAQARALVEYAVEHLDAKTFGILYPAHPYGVGLMNHFWDEVERRQLEVRGVERYDHDETTFQPIVRRLVGRFFLQYREEYLEETRRIRQEVTDPLRRRRALSRAQDNVLPIPEFDVLFIPDGYRTVGLIAPALAVEDVITNVCDQRDLQRIKDTTGRDELTKVRLLGPNAWHHPELITRGGRHVRCSVFVDGFFVESTRPQTRAFVEAYRDVHGQGSVPGYLEAYGYDTAAIVRHLVEELRPRDRAAFREALIGLPGYPGATGETRFDADGEVRKPLFFLTVDRDRIVEIEQLPAAPGG
jgi:branched-chain amino acid transport system substrate-binding protein